MATGVLGFCFVGWGGGGGVRFYWFLVVGFLCGGWLFVGGFGVCVLGGFVVWLLFSLGVMWFSGFCLWGRSGNEREPD